MARPKTGKPPKKNMVLTVDAQTRVNLDYISKNRQQSISSMVSEWADEEATAISERTGSPVPKADETNVEEV